MIKFVLVPFHVDSTLVFVGSQAMEIASSVDVRTTTRNFPADYYID